ncbi:HlyD family secretion protein [Shewanella sp. VB17]|uniref:HlyD family secretion protein n=1 Tax=Shewanella sp. VB17 TaxID=2739432 RepID=UPI0015662881|nr:HlyD family secretion protein [Shewanella sp. VB17]NRD75604.1 HlyD family secretion protein [Shewanella sp. VB17]
MSKSKLYITVPIIFAALISAGYYYWTELRFIESTDNAYVEADISHISVKVPGYVVYTDIVDNQHVQAGQLLAQLEDNQYKAKLAQSKAALDSVKAEHQTLAAKVALQYALINQATASVQAAKSDRLRAEQQLSRATKLKVKNYSSQDNVDQMQTNFASSVAHLDEARAALIAKQSELAVFKAQLLQVNANVTQAQAGLKLAEIQLADTQVRAPFSGIIGKRGAMKGQYVQPGQALYSLVPDDLVWITANFKETQIQHMQAGQQVKVTLDAFPDKSFTGSIDSLSPASGAKFSLLPAENATGNFTKIVQRIPVRISFNVDNEITNALPGLSAVVEIDTRKTSVDNAIAANAGH